MSTSCGFSRGRCGRPTPRPAAPNADLSELSNRELEIYRLVGQGVSTKEIARQLCLSVKTVETHRAQLMERLDIHNIAGLVRYAIRSGIIRDS